MYTPSRSVSPDIANVPPVIASISSQSVSSENASHLVPVQISEGHEHAVYCACFCPDENRLVSGSNDKTLRIWDRTTGEVEVLSGHTGTVLEVDVSWDGKAVASGSEDNTVRIWDLGSGEMSHVCEGHEYFVRSVQFSPDSRSIVSGSYDHTVRVWSVETGELAFEPIKCHGSVYCVRYSPDGDRIASGAHSVQIWDAETGVGIFSIRNSLVVSLAWTANIYDTHVIGGGLGEVTIWDSENGEKLRTLKAHDNNILVKVSLSPSGSHLATRGWNDKTALVFDISTGEQVAEFQHNGNVNKIAYSPSGQFIATACSDGKVCLWDAAAFKDPPAKSPASSFSFFLDQPAIPPAGPSRNDGRGADPFWDSPPNEPRPTATYRNQRGSSLPRRVLNRVGDTFSHLFTGHTARAAHNSPIGEMVELVGVAAGKDKPYVAIIDPPKFNRVQKILYRIIHCRKPDEDEEEDAAANSDTRPDPSQPPAGKTVIDTQPQSNKTMATVSSSNPSEIPATSKVSAFVSPQPTPSTLTSPAVVQGLTSATIHPSTPQAGPFTSSNAPPTGYPPTSMQFSSDPLQVERARDGKMRENAVGHPMDKAIDSQGAIHGLHRHDPQRDNLKAASTAYPAVDEADVHRVNSQLQEQNDQLRRQLDDAVAALRKAERDGLATAVEAGLSSQAEPSGSTSIAIASIPQGNASVVSDVPSKEHPVSSAQSIFDSIEAVERAKEDKRKAKTEKKKARRKRHRN